MSTQVDELVDKFRERFPELQGNFGILKEGFQKLEKELPKDYNFEQYARDVHAMMDTLPRKKEEPGNETTPGSPKP